MKFFKYYSLIVGLIFLADVFSDPDLNYRLGAFVFFLFYLPILIFIWYLSFKK